MTAVTAAGVNAKPFKLSEHKGETVVLAFFPKARTSGCTVQMESYRDKYAEMFNGGKKVTLVGVRFAVHLARGREVLRGAAQRTSARHDRVELLVTLRDRRKSLLVTQHRGVTEARFDLGELLLQGVEAIQHGRPR